MNHNCNFYNVFYNEFILFIWMYIIYKEFTLILNIILCSMNVGIVGLLISVCTPGKGFMIVIVMVQWVSIVIWLNGTLGGALKVWKGVKI